MEGSGGDGNGEDVGESGASPGPDGGGDGAALAGGEGGEEEEGLGDPDEEELEEDAPDPLLELQDKYDQLLELNERAMQHNVAFQRSVIKRKMQDKSYDSAEKHSEGKVTEHKYLNALHNVHSVRLKLRLQQVKAARMSEELKNQLETKRQKAIEFRDSFQEFKRQVAKHSEYARTGRKIPEKIIQEVEEFELDKDAEVEEVRGSNISLKNRLAKLEQSLRKKDELAENLHVIDFEQLKIENQTLNEKIEERNEELHKLKKKTVTIVQIITHMREKVQFVQQEYQVLKGELAQLDQDLASQRDLVTKTKHERDEHRSEYGKLKQQTGIMNSEHLTRDFEARAEHNKRIKEDIAQLKKRHGQMLQFVKRHGGKI
uniref:CCDC113/CCDC96 coiled-coil domain-containing protein n=1 Tax=Pyrodinium bahamense TaxID=73915 RepID=A0A7S0F9A1_9DINO